MRVGVVSDVHANLHALEAVLAAVDGAGVDELWCLGDLVGYGPRPNECCETVRARATVCLCGNHDLAVRGAIDVEEFSGDAAVAVQWTRDVLTPEAAAYLGSLAPEAAVLGVELVHGSPRDPVWEYVLSDEAALAALALTEAPLVLVGHSHVALQVSLHERVLQGGLAPDGTELAVGQGRWLLNPGSVGQPRDGDPRAAFLLLDLDARHASFRRAEYDVERTQSELREAGLPDVLAERLAVGM